MSIFLDQGTAPAGLEVKTYGILNNLVRIGEYQLSLKDFLRAAEYVLTNTDLEADDLRIRFVERIQSIRKVYGHNPQEKRFDLPTNS